MLPAKVWKPLTTWHQNVEPLIPNDKLMMLVFNLNFKVNHD